MPGKVSFALIGLVVLFRQLHAQEVIIAREESSHFPRAEVVARSEPKAETKVENKETAQSMKPPKPEQRDSGVSSSVAQVQKQEKAASTARRPEGSAIKPTTVATATVPTKTTVAPEKLMDPLNKGMPTPSQRPKPEATPSQAVKVATVSTPPKPTLPVTKQSNVASKVSTSSSPLKSEAKRDQLKTTTFANMPRPKRLTVVPGPADENHSLSAVAVPPANKPFEPAFVKLADGFDFAIGKPDAQGYYKARGFRSHGHLGEDWDGIRGGDTDLGDPIYSIGDGFVVFARDCHMGWGNVIIVRHSYRENGVVKNIDALYGHLHKMLVRRGQAVTRGQQIATMGTAHGLYDAHLHLEIRKNIDIGMCRTAFARDSSNYYDPTQFILTHRHLSNGGGYRVAMNTFVRDRRISFDKAKKYSRSRSRPGTRESTAALKKALALKQ